MVQQDQTEKCSNSSSGCGGIGGLGKSSRKPKPKKVPQRGLGVAQLEKIRIEEQQRKDAAAAILPTPCSVSPSKSSYLPPPIPNFHHSNQPSSSPIPLPSGSPADFRLPLSLQNIDAKVPSTVPLANSGNFEAGWPSVPVLGHGNVPKFWNSHEYEFEEFLSSMSLPYESNPLWSLPNWTQRTQQCQQPSSSMVTVSSGTLSAPALHYSMEPPSNQNYNSSSLPMWPEEKMIGLKRSYPFSLDVPPASFNFKLPTFTTSTKTNETISCGSGTGLNFDAANPTFRELPSCSTSNSDPNSKKSNKENENFNGDFLTLAPPTPTSWPTSKFKTTSTFPVFHNQEHPVFETPSCQGIMEDQVPPQPEYSHFNLQKQPLYSFFPPPPPAKAAQFVQKSPTRVQSCDGKVGESVDLILKL